MKKLCGFISKTLENLLLQENVLGIEPAWQKECSFLSQLLFWAFHFSDRLAELWKHSLMTSCPQISLVLYIPPESIHGYLQCNCGMQTGLLRRHSVAPFVFLRTEGFFYFGLASTCIPNIVTTVVPDDSTAFGISNGWFSTVVAPWRNPGYNYRHKRKYMKGTSVEGL